MEEALKEHGALLFIGASTLISLLLAIISYMLRAFFKDLVTWKNEIEGKLDEHTRVIIELKSETRVTNQLLTMLKEVINGQARIQR